MPNRSPHNPVPTGGIARRFVCAAALFAMLTLPLIPALSAFALEPAPMMGMATSAKRADSANVDAIDAADAADSNTEHLSRLLDEYRELLQKGLDIHEIDRELDRISAREHQVAEQIKRTEQRLEQEEQSVDELRERVGHILRAYYSGERISLLMVLFHINNWADAWTVIEYLQIIFLNDRELINRYLASYRSLKQSYEELQEIQQELELIRHTYLERREQLAEMQAELDRELEQLAEAEQVMAQIRELTEEWEQFGLPLFRRYFTALAAAMEQLPTIIVEYDDILTSRGLQWTFHLSDEVLNDFLRRLDESFHNLTFTFEEERIIAEGQDGDVVLYLAGQYMLEDEPVHHIGFELQELHYRGYELPESTRQMLNEEFDLGIYPQNIVPFVTATHIEVEEGMLRVMLELSMGSSRSTSRDSSQR